MSGKTEQVYFPDALWSIVKCFLFTLPVCILCATQKPKSRHDNVQSGSMLTNRGKYLCRCVRDSDGSLTFSYACTRHYALNNPMKIKLAQKEMFYRARELVTHYKVSTKELRTNISTNLTKEDLMRLLCSRRSKEDVGKEVLRLCKMEL